MGKGLVARQTGEYRENSPQGLKPTLLFSDVFSTTEVVPFHETCIGTHYHPTGDGLLTD
jgi:hypothetical protein